MGPDDVDIAQLQDTESGAEIMHLAETGLCQDGEQEALIQSGATRIDGRLPINTDGGCLACGEPIGASGLRQVTRWPCSFAATPAIARSRGRRGSASPRSTGRLESAHAPFSAPERPARTLAAAGPPRAVARGGHAHGDRPALVFAGAARTHDELHDRAARLASALAASGVRAGDRVALLLHNGFEFAESLLGVPPDRRVRRADQLPTGGG